MAEMTVESVCNALAKSKLLGSDEVKKAYQDWQREGGPKAKDTAEFGKWLITRQYLTSYQADRVLRGQTDYFFFNEYKLLERIGKGKMAGVYKGIHRLGQVVAIKVLPPSKVKDTEAFGRFQREARLAQRLKHANVVRTFQVGQSGPLHYLVMEHLEGETLADMIQRRGKIPPAEAAQIVYQALLGLSHIDEQKMVHRDLTPENLMILPSSVPGEPGVVKILDIGLGRATFEEGGANDVNLTREDSVLGSPDYLAPEQARSAHKADIRADIYSLGCVLYHAIAGQVVFPAKNAVQKMIAHASEKPRPLSTFANVPDALQQIMDNMIAKEPTLRYATPALAARQLKTFLESQTVSANAPQLVELVPAYANWLESTEMPMIAEAVPVPAGGAAPVAVAVPMSGPAGVNVELVPMQAPAASSTGLSMRSALLLLIVGASGMLVLLCGGWLAFQFLGKK
jgi:serine/threonine protein kinase